MPYLMEAHEGVHLALAEAGLEVVGTEGAVAAEDVARVEAVEELEVDGR